jgi:hypothetical protein
MVIWDVITAYTRRLSEDLSWLGNTAIGTPLIGNWCSDKLFDVSDYLLDSWIQMVYIGHWIDNAEFRLTSILSWDAIRGYILSSWSWLNTIDDKIAARVSAIWPWLNLGSAAIINWVTARWTWLDDIDGRIWSTAYARITGSWSWLNDIWGTVRNITRAYWPWLDDPWGTVRTIATSYWNWLDTIDDRIQSTVTARWSWLNTIDDKIKHVAWVHIRPQLGDWFWSFVVLEVTLVSKIGYRVISTLWNMQWDDTNKEAR